MAFKAEQWHSKSGVWFMNVHFAGGNAVNGAMYQS